MSENDPRLFFAAERTLLAWVRTGIAMIGLGFVVARFGLFLSLIRGTTTAHSSFPSVILGAGFIALGSFSMTLAAWQHARFVSTLSLPEKPSRYWTHASICLAMLLTLAGLLLATYLVVSSAINEG